MRQGELFQPTGSRPLRIMAGGHDVTVSMPLTLAELNRQRPKSGTNDTLQDLAGCHKAAAGGGASLGAGQQVMTPGRSIGRHSSDRTCDTL